MRPDENPPVLPDVVRNVVPNGLKLYGFITVRGAAEWNEAVELPALISEAMIMNTIIAAITIRRITVNVTMTKAINFMRLLNNEKNEEPASC